MTTGDPYPITPPGSWTTQTTTVSIDDWVNNPTTGVSICPPGTVTRFPNHPTFTIQKAENGFLLTLLINGETKLYLAKDANELAQQVVVAMVEARLTDGSK